MSPWRARFRGATLLMALVVRTRTSTSVRSATRTFGSTPAADAEQISSPGSTLRVVVDVAHPVGEKGDFAAVHFPVSGAVVGNVPDVLNALLEAQSREAMRQ